MLDSILNALAVAGILFGQVSDTKSAVAPEPFSPVAVMIRGDDTRFMLLPGTSTEDKVATARQKLKERNFTTWAIVAP
jgi:hypothetical protein